MTEPHNPPPAAPGPGAGPIAELIRVLADLGLRPESRELAGALWLALRIDRTTPGWSALDTGGAQPQPAPRKPSPARWNDTPAASGDGSSDGHATGSTEPERAAGIPAFPLTARAAAGAVAASAVSVPERSYLPQALHLGRAWRMLRRRRPSRRECALDLDATVERFVEQRLHRQGLWGLVYRARSVPWLDLTLVIDRGPAMAVWEPQVRELTALLRRTGAFGTVRIRHLDSATAAPRLFDAGRPVPAAALGKPLPGAAPGHMLTLVLSDGISRAWYDPATYRLLHRLGRDGLAVLVQLLPANRWIDTALGAGVEVRLGVARTRDPKLPVIAPLAGDAGALPVISQTPWGVRTLVDLPRGGGPAAGLIGYRLDGPGVALSAASPYGTDPPPAERLERFLSVASPAGRRLAGYLSRLPYPLTVRMMLLVQRAMQPGDDLSALAEVFSGGLLELHRPAGPGHPKSYRLVGQGTDRPDPGPVVRALANLVSRDEAWTVLCTLTSALKRSGQHPAADWPLLIEDAAAGAPFRLPAGLLDGDAWERALALIAVDVARRRGGAWLRGGERLAQALAGPPPAPTPRVPDQVPTPPPTAPTPFRDPFTDGSSEAPEMIWLPDGTFRMGSPTGDDNERPVHEVTLSHYAVGEYPVTVGEFRRFCESTGYRTEAEQGDGAFVGAEENWGKKNDASWRNPYFDQDDRHPVVCIGWKDAQAYCDWLSRETGQTYGLLSEAQWEHACRAGSDALYCFGYDKGQLTDYAWYSPNADDGTHPVGEKRGNAWGLHDLHGNVWEWCRDWYSGDYYQQFVGSAARTDAPELSAAHGPRSGPLYAL